MNYIKDCKKYIINYINQVLKFKSLNDKKVKLIKPIIYSDKPIIKDNKIIHNLCICIKNNSKYIIMFSLIISKKQNIKDKYYKLNIYLKNINYLNQLNIKAVAMILNYHL